jgi:N-acetylmuramoyl-L-alanine amidase
VLDISGELCAPIEALVSASGQSLVYGASGEIIIKGTPSFPDADEVYDSEELYWLSRIISAEARGECFEGQLAVGCVVINRTEHRSFPDTIYEVIFDDKFGVQFSPAHSGSVHKAPTESSVRAAKVCLEGFSLSDSILFFFNSSIAAGSWITSNRTYTLTIGNHDFYS